jgi:RNA polymerase sigma-70 factor (ECF subfamily)
MSLADQMKVYSVLPEDQEPFLEALREGGNEFVRLVITAYEPAIRRRIRRYTLGDVDVEDELVHLVWIQMLRRRMQFRGSSRPIGSAFGAWLQRLVRTICGRWRRSRKAHAPVHSLEAVAVQVSLSEEEVLSRLAVETCLRRLPARQRTAMQLSILEGLTDREIAERMHCALGTVKANLFKARHNLRTKTSWPL